MFLKLVNLYSLFCKIKKLVKIKEKRREVMKRMGIMFMFALGLSSLQAQSSKCFEVFNRSAKVTLGSAVDLQFAVDVQFARSIVVNNVQEAQEALEAGANKDARILVNQFTPKQVAQLMAKNNSKDNELVQHHLSEAISAMRPDIIIEPATRVTPLVLAHALGHKEMVEFLTKQQAKFAINDAEININQLKTSYGREALKPILANYSKNKRVMGASFLAAGTGLISMIAVPFIGQGFDHVIHLISPEANTQPIVVLSDIIGVTGAAVAVISFFPLLTSFINSFYHDRKLKEANELKFINGRYKDVGEGVEVVEKTFGS